MVAFFPRRMFEYCARLWITGNGELALIKRLGTHFSHVIDAHETHTLGGICGCHRRGLRRTLPDW
jgi:hypothetical protein